MKIQRALQDLAHLQIGIFRENLINKKMGPEIGLVIDAYYAALKGSFKQSWHKTDFPHKIFFSAHMSQGLRNNFAINMRRKFEFQ